MTYRNIRFQDASLEMLQELLDILSDIHPQSLDEILTWAENRHSLYYFAHGWRFRSRREGVSWAGT